MSLSKRVIAEFIGRFWLVFGGCGSAVLAAFPSVGIGLLGESFAFGLTVLTMAYAIGHILRMSSESGRFCGLGCWQALSRFELVGLCRRGVGGWNCRRVGCT